MEQKATRNKAAVWSVKPWYARDTDKTNFRTRTSFIHLVTNGGPCCVPALPSCLAELKKTQETLLDNLKDAIDLAKDIIKMTPDSDYKLAFKYLCQALKTGEAIASEAKPSTGHASLKNVSQPPPAIIPPSQPAPVRLRHQPLPPASTQTTNSV